MNYDGLEDIKRMYGKARARGKNEGTEEIRNLFEEDDEPKLKEDGDRVKTWRFGKILNTPLTKAVMATVTPHIDMRVLVVYSLVATSIKEMVESLSITRVRAQRAHSRVSRR